MGFFRGGQVIQSPVDSGVGNCNLVMHYLAFGSWIPLEYWIDCTPALEHDLDCETRRTGFRKVLNGETNKGKYSILDIQPPHRSHRSDPIYKHIYIYISSVKCHQPCYVRRRDHSLHRNRREAFSVLTWLTVDRCIIQNQLAHRRSPTNTKVRGRDQARARADALSRHRVCGVSPIDVTGLFELGPVEPCSLCVALGQDHASLRSVRS